ncbi:hypothetical protein ACOSQ2_014638 [Xanthoceras sorbifolium]|uniref:Phytocyanin domain-containing protein n=1 Tax=Xanthoceras sorbifolium TaxID=99658 RepID=A0ABQ8I4X7_9ROSI|nr:hypothetical protein JRO89_XS04G0117300 [Xanthoceras sorbifolium]
MAFNRGFVLFLLAAAMSAPMMMSSAKEFIVGDDSGWSLGFDYQAWAVDKNFQVGDKLVFKYQAGAHTVFKVNGTGFQSCIKPPANEALTTGDDTIVLATPGKKWYICGVGNHCDMGQKLTIVVQPLALSPIAAPSPSPLPGKPYPWKKVAKRPFLKNLHW